VIIIHTDSPSRGIARINAIGNLGGLVEPSMMFFRGWTGSFNLGLLLGLMIFAGGILAGLIRQTAAPRQR
jgi:hypothetical protein